MQSHISKKLREIELILIDLWARPAYSCVFPFARRFNKDPQVFSEMEIAEQHISLQYVAVGALGLLSPKRIVKTLVALANFTTDGEIPVPLLIERDVFERIPEVGAADRIAKVREVVIIACFGIWRFRGTGRIGVASGRT